MKPFLSPFLKRTKGTRVIILIQGRKLLRIKTQKRGQRGLKTWRPKQLANSQKIFYFGEQRLALQTSKKQELTKQWEQTYAIVGNSKETKLILKPRAISKRKTFFRSTKTISKQTFCLTILTGQKTDSRTYSPLHQSIHQLISELQLRTGEQLE